MITITLITDRLRQIAGKLKTKETLNAEDETFAANALVQFAERLVRKSAAATRSESDLLAGSYAEHKRVSILESRIEKQYAELCGLKVELKTRRSKSL